MSRRVVALACAATLALAACGNDGFDADELIAELNEHGAGLELGESLQSSREGIEIYGLEFAREELGEHGGHGSLTITADDEAGIAEYERCEAAGALLCFRAANAVLIFEDELETDERARLAAALRALESG